MRLQGWGGPPHDFAPDPACRPLSVACSPLITPEQGRCWGTQEADENPEWHPTPTPEAGVLVLRTLPRGVHEGDSRNMVMGYLCRAMGLLGRIGLVWCLCRIRNFEIGRVARGKNPGTWVAPWAAHRLTCRDL